MLSNEFIVVHNLTKQFAEQRVIDGMSFSVRAGEITGLLGPNGSGKTTMVRLLNGLLHPDAGQMLVAGYNPMTEGKIIRKISGVLTESADFYRHMSGLDNLLFFGRLYGITNSRRAEELLDTFGLSDHKHKAVGTYSTGMRKRLGLAKALLHEPDILFLDEPTNGLDPEGVRHVLAYIRQLNEEFGTTIFICSHLLNQMEHICHRYLFIDKGRIIEQGKLEQLRARHRQAIDVVLEVDAVPEHISVVRDTLQSVQPGTTATHQIICSVAHTEQIPQLIEALVRVTKVYSAKIEEPDLESLYFAVQEGRQNSA